VAAELYIVDGDNVCHLRGPGEDYARARELLVAEIAGRRPDRVAEIEQLLHDRSVADGLLAAPEGEALLSDARPPAGR